MELSDCSNEYEKLVVRMNMPRYIYILKNLINLFHLTKILIWKIIIFYEENTRSCSQPSTLFFLVIVKTFFFFFFFFLIKSSKHDFSSKKFLIPLSMFVLYLI